MNQIGNEHHLCVFSNKKRMSISSQQWTEIISWLQGCDGGFWIGRTRSNNQKRIIVIREIPHVRKSSKYSVDAKILVKLEQN